MTTSILIAAISVAVIILVHTGALFFWGGKTARLLQTHDKEITGIRERESDANAQFSTLGIEVGVMKEQIRALTATFEVALKR